MRKTVNTATTTRSSSSQNHICAFTPTSVPYIRSQFKTAKGFLPNFFEYMRVEYLKKKKLTLKSIRRHYLEVIFEFNMANYFTCRRYNNNWFYKNSGHRSKRIPLHPENKLLNPLYRARQYCTGQIIFFINSQFFRLRGGGLWTGLRTFTKNSYHSFTSMSRFLWLFWRWTIQNIVSAKMWCLPASEILLLFSRYE